MKAVISAAEALLPANGEMLELGSRGLPELLDRGPTRRFIPMRNWRVRLSGSRLHPATSRKARVYRAALRAWVLPGAARLTHCVEKRRSGEWPLGDLLLQDMPELATAAVSVGIPGPAQKVTAQLMDGWGRVLGFAKYADNSYTRSLLANEVRMLDLLPGGVAPEVVLFTPFLDGELLVQTALPGRPRTPRLRLDGAQVDFFGRLVRFGEVYPASEHPFIASARVRAGERGGMAEGIFERLESSRWPVAWQHGDMAPWNMHWWRGRCLAFDWEHGKEKGFPYLDAAAALIQVSTIIRRMEPRRAKSSVSEGLREALPASYARFAPEIAALSALDMILSWYPPRPPDANLRWLEEFIEAP